MKHFFIITNRPKDTELKITYSIKQYLESHGKKCTIQLEEVLGEENLYTDVNSIPEDVECILVLGGDGTLLQAARDTMRREIPLLGINLGTLGYLAEVECSNLEKSLEGFMKDSYQVEERMMLKGKIIRKDQEIEDTFALNDIVITRGGTLRIINFDIFVNGQFLKGYNADGIIISTPTGSTGYNMSAGGPLVEPRAKLMVLTPICPHTLNTRSIVLAPEDQVTIEITSSNHKKNQEIEANFDGSHAVPLCIGDKIQIEKSQKVVKIIKLSQVSFLETLHKKMSES